MYELIEFGKVFLHVVNVFFVAYLIGYSTYLFLCATVGSYTLYKYRNYRKLSNRLSHEYYVPVSILVPAHNEELNIVDTVRSLLDLNYKLYEIIVVDDGSTDDTSKKLIEFFKMEEVDRRNI